MSLAGPNRPSGDGRAIGLGALISLVGILPAFLVGSLAVLISLDFAFTNAQLGTSVGAFFAAAGIASPVAGRRVDRYESPRRPVVVGALFAVSGAALVASAPSGLWVVAGLVCCGIGHAIVQVAVNRFLAGRVAVRRHGVAFGVKQAAIPGATLVAGMTVPTLALSIGWRAAFGVVAVFAAVVATMPLGVHAPAATQRPAPLQPARPDRFLVLITIVVALGSGIGTSIGSFTVPYLVAGGRSAGNAGLILALASALSVAARIAWGWWIDCAQRRVLHVTVWLLLVGGAALLALPRVADSRVGTYVVIALLFGAGWAWSGLLTLAVVRRYSSGVAAASGVFHVGIYVGSVVGPSLFGIAVDHLSYSFAWYAAGGAFIGASVLLAYIDRAVVRDL